jgi:hypothetical protein
MAEIRCPNCGKNNPDLLDVCQFCQTPLKPESVLRIGDRPTKKHTGELESVLPEWLKDVRQQARNSAEEEAAQAAANPKPQKNEPPDLLAGLASQSGSGDEDEVPDWLASMNPAAKPKSATPPAPASAPETDFFAQFNQSTSKSASEPAQEDVPTWKDSAPPQSPISEEKDELSQWFSEAAQQPEEFVELNSDAGNEAGWSNLNSPLASAKDPPPKEEEDLSWLRNLEEASKQTGDLKSPKPDADWRANFELPSTPSQPASSQEDLSWLNSLGGIEETPQQGARQAERPSDDLTWLSGLDANPQPSQPFDAAPDRPIASTPFASEEDLSWLNNLGGAAEPLQPSSASDPEATDKPFAQEDLSWLNNLGGTSEQAPPVDATPARPSMSQEEPSWLKGLGGEAEPLSAPPFAESEFSKEEIGEAEPDWLKSATEAPSMPPPGDLSMDWFTSKDQPVEEKSIPTTPHPPPFSDLFAAPSEPSPLSNQDVDSLFSMEMPDWLSRPESPGDEPVPTQTMTPSTEGEESLAPVDLPSWVQAMRPMEALIDETATSVADQPEEKEGPLAGLRGVIPGAPIGSSRRPKAISLKLQATNEQQASVALLEQILGSETSPRSLISSSFIASQQVLRWALTGLFLLVLSAMIISRSQIMPISPDLPVGGSNVSNTVMSIPAGANLLVIVDYDPSLAGEMEAIAGPLLDQMVLLGHPTLSFLSTSPNGSALAERLLTNTKINTPDGFAYQAGTQYFNLGYLPGGAAGVLGFVERPAVIIPASGVESFSEYDALIVMTDHAESGRVWVEQLQTMKQIDPALTNQPLLMVASAQAGPLLQPYVASGQVNGMISGLSEAARYELVNNSRPGLARSYWDTFGIGLALAVVLIVAGSLWSVFAGMRARRAETQSG